MKKLLFIMLFVFASTLTSLANITVNEARLNVLANEKSMILSFSNESEKVESLTITDFSGIVFYSEEMDKYEYGVKYSLEKLPYGKYRVKVTGQNFIEFHEIFVDRKSVV